MLLNLNIYYFKQKKKIEDKHEKHRKEAENAKHKYQQALEELNENNARYIEDMKTVIKTLKLKIAKLKMNLFKRFTKNAMRSKKQDQIILYKSFPKCTQFQI